MVKVMIFYEDFTLMKVFKEVEVDEFTFQMLKDGMIDYTDFIYDSLTWNEMVDMSTYLRDQVKSGKAGCILE